MAAVSGSPAAHVQVSIYAHWQSSMRTCGRILIPAPQSSHLQTSVHGSVIKGRRQRCLVSRGGGQQDDLGGVTALTQGCVKEVATRETGGRGGEGGVTSPL